MPSLGDRSRRIVPTPLATLIAHCVLVSAIAGQSRTPNARIDGAWTLNVQQSDDVETALAKTREGRSTDHAGGRFPGGMGRGTGRRGGGGRGMGGRGGGDQEQMKQLREVVAGALEAPARLTITDSGDAVTFVDGEGRSLQLPTDSKRQKHQFAGREVESNAKWDDSRLIKETALGNGMKVIETYTVLEPRQLVVTARLEGGPLPTAVTVRRVYDELGVR